MASKQELIKKAKDEINDLQKKHHTVIDLYVVKRWLEGIERAK